MIDPLAMPVGADTDSVKTTLQTMRMIRDELGVNMCCGASNVSFGLPERHALNATFLPMAMAAGLTCAIMSTAEVCVQSVRAADLLLGHDDWGASWIAAHRARLAAAQARPSSGRCAGGRRVVSGAAPQRVAQPARGAARRRGRARARATVPSASACSSCRTGPRFRVPSGTPVFDAASWNGIAIDSTCGGYGTCKKCKVRVVSGELPVGPIDPRAFTQDELDDGWRLACRAAAARPIWSSRCRRCRRGRRPPSPASAGT